ncbi:UxaA family hydrolase, partial [Clostridioides difficile]
PEYLHKINEDDVRATPRSYERVSKIYKVYKEKNNSIPRAVFLTYGVIVVSLGCENCQNDLVVDAIKERTNKPIKTLVIQEEHGTL